MAPIRVSRTIDAPQAHVFELMTDLHTVPQRMQAIKSIDVLTDGPIGVGTRWRETRTMFGRDATEEMWITEFVPPSHWVVEADNCGVHYRSTLRANDLGDGRTEAVFEFSGEPKTLMARLMMPMGYLLRNTLRKCFADDLNDLAVAAEAKANEGGSEPEPVAA